MKILDIPQSGSLGNQTSSRNRSGQYRRQRSMPTQPRTAAQMNQRARLTTHAAGWRGLTDAQRASWNSFAASFTVTNSLGQAISLTGHQCFVKVNTVNSINGDATVTSPPSLPSFIAATVTALTSTAGTPLVSVAGSSPASGTKFMFFASPQLSAGVSYNGDYRWLKTMTTATSSAFALTTEYVAKFGTLIAGKKIFVKVIQSQAGMQDSGTFFSATIGA